MRALLPALALGLAVPLAAQSDNVLLIVADDLGVDYVGAYGEGTNPPPTPHIDALATGGVLFRNAWAHPSCSPSRASILTGRYAFRTMVGRWISFQQSPPNVGLLQDSEWTIPEILDADGGGYAHAMIGKWHLGNAYQSPDMPRQVGGFSHFAGSLEGQIPSYTSWTRVVDGVPAQTSAYCTTQNTDDALSWIQQQTQPWLCVLTYQAPHIPYHAPPAHLHTQNLTGLTPQPNHTPQNIPFYRAMVESLDTEIGRLLATLGPGVLAATNVVFVADNGTVQRQSVAPFDGTRAKGTPYEGGVNVPLLIRGPAVQQPGREVGALVNIADIFATVLDLTGALDAAPPYMARDSVSLAPYLSDPNQAPLRDYAYSEQFTGTTWPAPNNNGYAIVRDAQYKRIHYYGSAQDRLYDLVSDPWENTNLINSSDPQVQQAAAALLAQIQGLRATGGAASAFAVFGDGGCVGSAGVPEVSGSGSPETGLGYTVQLAGAAVLKPAVVSFGTSWQSYGGATLPLSLAPLGAAPGCELWASPDVLLPSVTGFTGGATRFVSVPNNGALIGETVFHSWVVVDPAAPGSASGLVATDALAVTIQA